MGCAVLVLIMYGGVVLRDLDVWVVGGLGGGVVDDKGATEIAQLSLQDVRTIVLLSKAQEQCRCT